MSHTAENVLVPVRGLWNLDGFAIRAARRERAKIRAPESAPG